MKVCIVGLGYVGLPLAVAFAERKIDVIGFDVNNSKIKKYKEGIDVTCEVGNERLQKSNLYVTSTPSDIKGCNIFIVAVPTPTTSENLPDLGPIEGSIDVIYPYIKKNDIIVFESTVYPGITEDLCGKLLEEKTGLVCGEDIYLGYSPERINPGDKEHRLETIVKIVSGQNDEVTDTLCDLYGKIIDAGIHRAPNIKVAEAAKVIENAQRDINIAFVNELSVIFNKLGISTEDVLKAANTKWNFLDFKPGLVGGHCIGVDPFYLAHCATENGIHAEVILSGRNRNDSMANEVTMQCIKRLSKLDKPLKECKVAVIGITFKENCPDTRNSKVMDIISGLKEYSINYVCSDEIADYDFDVNLIDSLVSFDDIENVDAFIFAVGHNYIKNIEVERIKEKFIDQERGIILDLKWVFSEEEISDFDTYRF